MIKSPREQSQDEQEGGGRSGEEDPGGQEENGGELPSMQKLVPRSITQNSQEPKTAPMSTGGWMGGWLGGLVHEWVMDG